MNYKTLREEACEANLQLPKLGLVMFTFGNVSVVDRAASVFAIKPSGVPYDQLTPDMMVIVDYDGIVQWGNLRPSSDTLTHAVLYKHWSSQGAVVHTHSTYATAWAQAGKDIPIFGTTHADHLTVDVPCAPPMDDARISGNYELETGYQIIDCFKSRNLDPTEVEMMLVGNHAPFAWGKTASKALYHAAVLEELARMAHLTLQINPAAPRLKNSLIQKHHQRKHGPDSYYGQST
jgi:L-ribulose-5-phosphate 4-epimerase